MPSFPSFLPTHAARRCLVAGLVVVLAACGSGVPAPTDPPVEVFAAASLSDALGEIGHVHEERTGQAARFSFASSAALARQIELGAPAQIFASADARWMDRLAADGLIESESRVSPIGNELVLVAPARRRTAPLEIVAGADLAGLLGPGDRIAVGDPAHVPAGSYAREALESLGLYAALAPRFALSDDVRAALALVERGEAALGIVYRTDAAISDRVAVLGTFPAASHRPITYPFAIVRGAATPAVRSLFEFMTGASGREIFARYGFTPPEGE